MSENKEKKIVHEDMNAVKFGMAFPLQVVYGMAVETNSDGSDSTVDAVDAVLTTLINAVGDFTGGREFCGCSPMFAYFKSSTILIDAYRRIAVGKPNVSEHGII